MLVKHKIEQVYREHPDWCGAEIAREVGCDPTYVSQVARDFGLPLANKQGKHIRSVFKELCALGRAARAAGLTIADLERMGRRQ